MIRRLEKAARVGIDLEGNPKELLGTLTSDDIPLLNRARAAVLGRLSDECLYEYNPMTYTVRALRHYLAPAGEHLPGLFDEPSTDRPAGTLPGRPGEHAPDGSGGPSSRD